VIRGQQDTFSKNEFEGHKSIARGNQATRRRCPIYLLRLQSPGIRRLRLLLKALLRRFGLRCLSVEEERP
jgi:hypothetical protein